jgi:hypothetical protein
MAQSRLSESKATRLSSLKLLTEQARNKIDFIDTTDLHIVRALLIYLEVQVWSINELLIGIARSMGHHRDPAAFYPDFGAEMRRTVW